MLYNHYPFNPDVTRFDAHFPEDLRLILASASPRRRELLGNMGLSFTVLPADADESIPEGITPCQAVGLLSVRKAYAALPLLAEGIDNAVIIASDTIVDFEGKALGKPLDEDDAFKTLMMMSAEPHKVHTGCTVYLRDRLFTAVTTSTVVMRPYGEEEVRAYIESGEPMGKAGSYAIQGLGGKLVDRCEGMLDNVIGLPTATVAELLKRALEAR